ncbi:hypothetical protein U1Q18_048386 [Sarracenia purpurea var. burkii]
MVYLHEFHLANELEMGGSHTHELEVKWKPRDGIFFKVNFDGAMKKNNYDGIRVMIRDNRGGIVASMIELIQQNNDSDLVECLALWKAVRFARDLGI